MLNQPFYGSLSSVSPLFTLLLDFVRRSVHEALMPKGLYFGHQRECNIKFGEMHPLGFETTEDREMQHSV
jgi:hypothetical protein